MEITFKPSDLLAFFFWRKGLLILLSLVPVSVLPQNPKIDSLRLLLDDKTKATFSDVIYEMAKEYIMIGNYDSADKCGDKLHSIGLEQNDSLLIVRGQAINATVLGRQGYIDSAKRLYENVLPIAKRNLWLEEAKSILNSLGIQYTYEARYDIALKYHFESLKLREELGNKFDISISLNNIGLVYYKLSNYDKALAFYMQSLELKRAIGDRFDLDGLLLNIGLCYTHQRDFVKARKFVNEAFLLCKNDCSDSFLMSAFFGSGLILFEEQNLVNAEIDFLKSYLLAKKIGDIRYQFDNILALSKIYDQQNRVGLFEQYLKEAEVLIAKESNYNRELLGIYSELVNLYRQTDNLESINFYQHKYIGLRETIFNEEMAINLMKSEAEFLERQNQTKIESQSQIMALNREVIRRQGIVNIFFGVLVILVIMLAIVLARSNKQKQLINKLLDQKVKERTYELSLNRDALHRAWLERDALINKASHDFKSSVATIKGLVFLGLKDIDHTNRPQYLHKLNTHLDHLADVLNKIVDFNNTVGSMEKPDT